MVMPMKELISQICGLVRRCGDIMLSADRSHMQVDSKEGAANFVTEYDSRVQEVLSAGLREILPSARFIGEEGERTSLPEQGFCFIVDPIDGTTNFIKDYHMSSISVALLSDGAPYIGVIYNPYLNEMYWAGRGIGAFCNETPIRVSSQPLSRGLVLFGTSPYNRRLAPETFRLAYACYMQALDIRRSGSAALDLCAIAAGRAELYIELTLSPWDYAAGSLLIAEAGGRITTLEGEPLRFDKPCSVLACNGVATLPGGFSCS